MKAPNQLGLWLLRQCGVQLSLYLAQPATVGGTDQAPALDGAVLIISLQINTIRQMQ